MSNLSQYQLSSERDTPLQSCGPKDIGSVIPKRPLDLEPSNQKEEVKRDRLVHKRRRKTTSCEGCRKLKTRCDFEPLEAKCHRCNVLKIDCSLTMERKDEILASISKAERRLSSGDIISDEANANNEADRLRHVERKLDYVLNKLDKIVGDGNLMRANADDEFDSLNTNQDWKVLSQFGSVKSNFLDNSVRNSSFGVISAMDSRLFKRTDPYQLFERRCRDAFLENFYHKHKDLVLRLGTDFLRTAHFWIIPGGISRITNEYVWKHPFITAVFVLIAMSFDDNYQYVQEQEELHWIVKNMLGLALITTPLTDHDIEAILYCCIYNICRKPLQSLVDTWSLSGDGIRAIMVTVKFHEVRKRVLKEKKFDYVDLFHLRIWILLSISHLTSAIGNGRPHLIPPDYYQEGLSELVLDFPMMTLGDNINHAHLQLVNIVYKMFHSKNLFERVLRLNEFEQIEKGEDADGCTTVFKFKELQEWRERWKELIALDLSGTLLFNIDFFYVTLSKRFVSYYKKVNALRKDPVVDKYLTIGYNTAISYSIKILQRVVNLPTSLIRGSPMVLWNQVVYSCLTLYEFNDKLVPGNFNIEGCLNLISRVYWQLNKIGETKNDATDTVGKIIKSLVDVTNQNQSDQEQQIQSDFELNDDFFIPLHDEISNDFSNDLNVADIVSKFSTFEEFFNDINKVG